MEFALDSSQLDAIAPFSIVCDESLHVEHIGPSLRKALGRELAGSALLEEFAIDRPHGIAGAEDIRARPGSAFLLRFLEHDLTLRCQAVFPTGGARIIFLGSIALASELDISRLGLGFADFAASDPTPDLLILKRSQERSLHDLAILNTELSRSSANLRTANTALTEAERRYRTLVEQQPLVTYIDSVGEDLTTEFVSDNIMELSGYPPNRWASEPNFFFSIVHPDDLPRVHREHLEAARTGAHYRGEFRLIRPDGAIVWVQAEDQLVLDDDGQALYRLGYMLDITERRTIEQQLRATGSRLATLVASLRTGVLMEDENRRVALTNRAFCSIFGIPAEPEELIGQDCDGAAEASKTLAADPEGFLARINEILQDGESVLGEEVEFADGRTFERDYVPLLIAGEQRGHLWGYRDVTPHIEAQRAIEAAHDQAVAASSSKTEFLATVSHEIRTPLHGVLGTLDLLKDTRLDGEQTELLNIIQSSAGALLAVINDMLDLQKTEAGRMELSEEPVELESLIGAVLDTVSARAEAKGLALTSHVSEGMPGDLLGDPARLRQILLNLVGERGQVHRLRERLGLRCGSTPSADGRRPISFLVADSGIGIPPHEQARIFEPFSQGDASTTRRHEGTGLGLAITRRLVELMDGDISVASHPR